MWMALDGLIPRRIVQFDDHMTSIMIAGYLESTKHRSVMQEGASGCVKVGFSVTAHTRKCMHGVSRLLHTGGSCSTGTPQVLGILSVIFSTLELSAYYAVRLHIARMYPHTRCNHTWVKQPAIANKFFTAWVGLYHSMAEVRPSVNHSVGCCSADVLLSAAATMQRREGLVIRVAALKDRFMANRRAVLLRTSLVCKQNTVAALAQVSCSL